MSKPRRPIADKRILAHLGWFVAAILILAVTGSELLSLVEEAASVESQELKSARRKTRELESLASAAPAAIDAAKLDRLVGRSAPARTSGVAGAEFVDEGPPLPRLYGIVRVVTLDGRIRYRATLDGRVVREKEKFDGYTVRRISDEGVVLVGGAGEEWLLRAPETGLTMRQE